MKQSRAALPFSGAILRLDPAEVERWPDAWPAAVMVDLTATDGPQNLAAAGERLRERPSALLVRTGLSREDGRAATLAAASAWSPDGVVLARCTGRADIQQLAGRLAVWEAEAGWAEERIAIVAECGTAALTDMDLLQRAGPRLVALAWNAGTITPDRAPLPRAVRQHVRITLALAAGAAGLSLLDTSDDLQPDALRRECRIARRLGFAGKVAAAADQLAVIAEIFEGV